MEVTLAIIFGSLVFLGSLLIFKVVFLAFLLTLLFIFLIFLSKEISTLKGFPVSHRLFKRIINLSMPAVFSLALYSFIYLFIEFELTEIFFKIEKLPRLLPIIFLLTFAFAFSFADWSRLLKKHSRITTILIVFFILSLGFGQWVRKEKLSREYLPKIYMISKNYGIQANSVEINGVNFGPAHLKGLVKIGEFVDFDISFWSEKKIIGKLGVPKKFGQTELEVIREDGIQSNKILFWVKDPKELR